MQFTRLRKWGFWLCFDQKILRVSPRCSAYFPKTIQLFFIMSQLIIQGVEFDESTALPFAESGPQAGFPSPVPSQYQEKIDLNRELVSHPESTFYAKVVGDSMIDANIYAGDILVVDRSIDFQNGDIAVCIVDDEFTVKHIFVEADHVRLVPANSQYPELRIESDQQFSVWGVVTYVIHAVRRETMPKAQKSKK